MSAITATSPAETHQAWEFEKPTCNEIVVGVDGSVESITALNTAAALARSRHCPLHAVSVLPPYPSYQINAGNEKSRENIDQLRTTLRLSELSQLLRSLEPSYNWTHEVVIGRPAREIVSIAERRGASLIVIGRRKHSTMDRVLGGETTLQVMRLSSVPVIAVERELQSVHTVVAAIDFSPSSVHAAKVALELIRASGGGTLYLAYVEATQELIVNEFMLPAETRFPGDIVVWFRRLTGSLESHAGIHIEPAVLCGKPGTAILEFAERVGADMIAAGSHGHGRLERFLLGSVSSGLVRNASCPVTVVPPGR
ncbi:MAG TPA: universal stress protein [Gemmatimonadaceae bacterium]